MQHADLQTLHQRPYTQSSFSPFLTHTHVLSEKIVCKSRVELCFVINSSGSSLLSSCCDDGEHYSISYKDLHLHPLPPLCHLCTSTSTSSLSLASSFSILMTTSSSTSGPMCVHLLHWLHHNSFLSRWGFLYRWQWPFAGGFMSQRACMFCFCWLCWY